MARNAEVGPTSFVPALQGLETVRRGSPPQSTSSSSSGKPVTPGRQLTPGRSRLRPPSERSSPRGRRETEWDLVLSTIAISHPGLLECPEAAGWHERRDNVLVLMRETGCTTIHAESLDCLALYALQGCKTPVTDMRLANRMAQLIATREPVVLLKKTVEDVYVHVSAASPDSRSEWHRFIDAMSKLGLATADMA